MIEENDIHSPHGTSGAFIGRELRGGRYLIQEKIAQGGSAWLFKAYHQILQEPMAIKLLYPQFLDNQATKSRFIEEARIQFRLNHQNIVHITDVIDETFCLGSVMEWVEGEDLRMFLRRQKRPLEHSEILSLFTPIIGALHFIHSKGLVHRDIKPANILLSCDGDLCTPKLTDFGIAKSLLEEGHTVTGSTLGTVTYMAPEQINDAKQVTPQADIYSVGVILFQLLTGEVPFQGTLQQQLIKHLRDAPPKPSSLNPNIPKELETLVLRCLAKEPHDRPENCEVLLDSLLSILKQKVHISGELATKPISDGLSLLPISDELGLESKNDDDKSGLNTELEFLLDHIIDENESDDGLPTILAGPDEQLGGKVSQVKPPTASARLSARGERAKGILTPTPPSSVLQAPMTPPISSRSSLRERNVGKERRKAVLHTSSRLPKESKSVPWHVLVVLGIVLVLVASGLTWAVFHKKPTNQINKQPLVSSAPTEPNEKTAQAKGPSHRICFNMSPKDTYFFFKFDNVRKVIKRNSFCINVQKKTLVLVWRERFHSCEFVLPARPATINLHIKAKNEPLSGNKRSNCRSK